MSESVDAATAGAVRASVDVSRLPWIRPLVRAYVHEFETVSRLFAGNPADPSVWRDTIDRVTRTARDRKGVAELLGAQLAARGAPPAACQAAGQLANPDCVAVVTGQQAGLFGGPLYALLKAVTTIQLARRLNEEHGVTAVPIFWADAEDHDWAEIRSTTILDADGAPRTITLDDLPGAGALPAGRLILTDAVAGTLDALEAALAPSEFRAEILDTLRRAYRPGVGLGRAFATWLDALLGHEGLVVFESDDPGAKPLVSDVFVRELSHPCRTSRLSLEAGATMSALGHHPQVEPAEDAVALFYLTAAGRQAVRFDGTAFVIGDERRDAGELGDEARQHPDRFSPNVLLRPLVQDRLFPTVAYVAGPSELAYQAQLKQAYAAFAIEPPLLYPRASATLLDSAAARFLDRSQVPIEDLQPQDEAVLNRLLQGHLPPAIESTMTSAEAHLIESLNRLREAVPAVDPTLKGTVDTTESRIRDTLKALHHKILQAAKRKDETLRRQFTRTQTLTFPDGQPQERVLGSVFFAGRYGPAIGRRLIDELPVRTDRHYLLTL